VAVAGLSALSSLWTAGAVRELDLSVLADEGGLPPSVSALGWDALGLRIGTVGQGAATWIDLQPGSALWPASSLVGQTVLSFPRADFADATLAPVLTLSPPIPPGAEGDLPFLGPETFAREGRAVVLRTSLGTYRAVPEGLTELVVSDGLAALVGYREIPSGLNNVTMERFVLRAYDLAETGYMNVNIPPSNDLTALAVAPNGSIAAAGTALGLVTWFRADILETNDNALASLQAEPFLIGGGYGRTAVRALSMAGQGDESVIAAAGADGRVVVLRALPMSEQSEENFPLMRYQPFRIGLPPYGFNLVRLDTTFDSNSVEANFIPMAVSADGGTVVAWVSERQEFHRFNAASGIYLGATAISDYLGDRPLEQDVRAIVQLVANSNAAAVSRGGDTIPTPLVGSAISDQGTAVIWGGESSSVFLTSLLSRPSDLLETELYRGEDALGEEIQFLGVGFSFDEALSQNQHRGSFRPGENRFVILGRDGQYVELALLGGTAEPITPGGEFVPPTASSDFVFEFSASQIAFPTAIEDVVLWSPTGEGGFALFGRYDRRTRDLLRTVEMNGAYGHIEMAERADIAVGVESDPTGLDVADTRNGQIVGRIVADNANGRFIAAPSADGRIVGFLQTAESIFVIHRTDAPPPAEATVSTEGLLAISNLIRPPPEVAESGLQLSSDGRMLMLRSKDGQLFVGGTDPNIAPGFFRDNDESLQACCLHLRALAPEERFTAAALSPDGRTVHGVTTDNRLLEVLVDGSGAPVTLLHLPGPATALAPSADGTLLAIGLGTAGVRVLDLARVELVAGLSQAPGAVVPAPVARLPPVVSAPTRPWGNVALLGAFATDEAARAARPTGEGRAFSILSRPLGPLLLVERLQGPASILDRTRALARVRIDVPSATLHWLEELCPGGEPPAPEMTCPPVPN